MDTILEQTEKLVNELNGILLKDYWQKELTCYINSDGTLKEEQKVHIVPKRKYYNLDVAGSGAWLIEKKTGEIFNIKAYGQVDMNKKRKADLGNVVTADPVKVYLGRWNYLR